MENTTISDIIRSSYPEIVSCMGNFPEDMTFDIGFVNPDLEIFQEDNVANDEVEFTAEGLSDLEQLYKDFCSENNFPTDTVRYVDLKESVTTICYGERRVWKNRSKAADFFLEGILNSDGSEQLRYARIYYRIKAGLTVCTDDE